MEAEKPIDVSITPAMLRLFDDKDDFQDFLECLSDRELSIIKEHPEDAQFLMTLVKSVRDDVDETAKDLAISG